MVLIPSHINENVLHNDFHEFRPNELLLFFVGELYLFIVIQNGDKEKKRKKSKQYDKESYANFPEWLKFSIS